MEAKTFTTSDGVTLNYLEAGSGPVLVMIPGWSQTAEQWKYQIWGLQERYRCLAIDMRGHGDSAKVDYGYKIHRLSADVREFILGLDLADVTLMGHSMGCSVIWGYFELFGRDRLAKLILVDQSPFLTSNPAWSAEELAAAGAIFDAEAVANTCNALAGPDGNATTRGFIGGMVTSGCSPELQDWIVELNFKLPRSAAAALLYNHCHQDWRDLIPRIDLPTLVIGGRVSLIPWRSVAWTAEQIPGARLEIFEEEEGGQHFMFIENPAKFNAIIADFLG